MNPHTKTAEISVKGKWHTVPASNVNGNNIIVTGRWIRIARIESEDWLETELNEPESCVQLLKGSSDLSADLLSFAQKVPMTLPKYQYPMEWDSIAAVRLATFAQWWEHLPKETRKNVRRAEKRGVVVQVKQLDENLIRGLRDLNNDAPIRQGKRFWHYGKTLEQVTKDQQAFLDRSDYICASYENELIGVIKLIYLGDKASILTFLPKTSHHDKRPANALMAKAVELCIEKKLSHLMFGQFNHGNKRHTSLREFKIRHGFEEIVVPRYYVPLTPKGAAVVKLRLYRGLMGVLPHDIITFLVNSRARLHSILAGVADGRPVEF